MLELIYINRLDYLVRRCLRDEDSSRKISPVRGFDGLAAIAEAKHPRPAAEAKLIAKSRVLPG